MIQEVKRITLGSVYDFISLDKYTNDKDSIKIRFKDTGDEFYKWSLENTGTIRIENGVINYKDYESAHNIEMIIEYNPSRFPLKLEDIDTLEGLKRNITDLKSLDYISDMRIVANRKFEMRLNKFVLFNAIVFDDFGQTWKLEYENIDKYDYSIIQDFMTIEDFKGKVERFSMCSGYIPEHDSICPHCGERWTLKNLRDCMSHGDNLYHKYYNQINLYEKSKKEFDYIASEVFDNYIIVGVKNQYGSESYNGSWFIIKTSEGNIKIGWRKRVMEIEWLDNYKEFKFNGEDEDVTKKFSNKERYIHADNTQKAIEYLRKAKRTIIL